MYALIAEVTSLTLRLFNKYFDIPSVCWNFVLCTACWFGLRGENMHQWKVGAINWYGKMLRKESTIRISDYIPVIPLPCPPTPSSPGDWCQMVLQTANNINIIKINNQKRLVTQNTLKLILSMEILIKKGTREALLKFYFHFEVEKLFLTIFQTKFCLLAIYQCQD